MARYTDMLSEDLRRIPGLFRRWELSQVLEAHRRYHIEDAGEHTDGTPLFALYMESTLDDHRINAGVEDDNDPGPPSLVAADGADIGGIAEVTQEFDRKFETERRTPRAFSKLIDRFVTYGAFAGSPIAVGLNRHGPGDCSDLPIARPPSTDV
jgi:hypothetical protein